MMEVEMESSGIEQWDYDFFSSCVFGQAILLVSIPNGMGCRMGVYGEIWDLFLWDTAPWLDAFLFLFLIYFFCFYDCVWYLIAL